MKFKKPLFSLLIANYNNGQYLEECLQSVFNQTYNNWEIIIVDDASTDNSREVYKKYENNNSINIFYNDVNRGAGYTKRKCAELANGEICGFLDPDDALTPEALQIMVYEHLKRNDHSIIYSTHYICNSNLNILEISTFVSKIPPSKSHLTHPSISHLATFKKTFYDKTSGISSGLKRAVDQDLYLKLEEVGSVYFINKPLYYYRKGISGISQGTNEFKAEYWSWITKIDAAQRRGVDIENVFSNFYNEKCYSLKKRMENRIDYKVGKMVLRPYRLIKHFLKYVGIIKN